MTRGEFIRAYAERRGLDARWKTLGFIECDGRTLIAMPCGCGDETCERWAMVRGENISSHLSMYAPEKLRDAYREALGEQLIF